MDKIVCRICGAQFSRILRHASQSHGVSAAEYTGRFPGAPTVSEASKKASSTAWDRRRGKAVVKRHSIFFSKEAKEATLGPKAPESEPTPEAENLVKVEAPKAKPVMPHVPKADPDWEESGSTKTIRKIVSWAGSNNENVLIVGPTGCGKSATLLQMAAETNQPCRRLNLSGEVRVSDFVGEKTVEVDPQTQQAIVVWKDGVLPQAMRNGQWLILDELDAAPPHVLFALQSVLEKGRALTLAGNGGEVVKAAKGFRILATANTIGKGDDTGLYAGTNVLNEAFLDRFAAVVQATYMEAQSEADLLVRKSGIPLTQADQMVRVANLCRKAMRDGDIFTTFSTRRLLAWASLSKESSVMDAFNFTVLNKAGEDRKTILALSRRIF